MENKDQRLEIRIPQKQLAEVDAIINSIDPRFKPSRSDVVRAFIAQGIDRHYGRDGQIQDTLPLGQRISLFFQICQQLTHGGGSLEPLHRPGDRKRYLIPNFTESTATTEALVRRVYLQRMTWFFELDAQHLIRINARLGVETILSLMNPQHNPKICSLLDGVIALRDMFSEIKGILDKAKSEQNNDDAGETSKALTRIEGYAQDYGIPLVFRGYPDSGDGNLQGEMWAMLDWIEQGDGDCRIVDSRLRCDEDLTGKYAIMLEIYQNICLNQTFDLDSLERLVKSRQFYMA